MHTLNCSESNMFAGTPEKAAGLSRLEPVGPAHALWITQNVKRWWWRTKSGCQPVFADPRLAELHAFQDAGSCRTGRGPHQIHLSCRLPPPAQSLLSRVLIFNAFEGRHAARYSRMEYLNGDFEVQACYFSVGARGGGGFLMPCQLHLSCHIMRPAQNRA